MELKNRVNILNRALSRYKKLWGYYMGEYSRNSLPSIKIRLDIIKGRMIGLHYACNLYQEMGDL